MLVVLVPTWHVIKKKRWVDLHVMMNPPHRNAYDNYNRFNISDKVDYLIEQNMIAKFCEAMVDNTY